MPKPLQRDWAQLPARSPIGRLVRLPLAAIPKTTVLPIFSGVNRGMRWIVGSSVHGCWLGTYELDKQRTIQRFVRPGMTILDIGANAGFYTLAFSQLVGSSGQIWAFEPVAENVSNLLKHIRLNSLTNVTVVQAAVSDSDKIAGFEIAESNAMGALASEAQTYRVPTVSLDRLLADGEIPVPDLIKMDVEGAESSVLEGAHNVLSHRRTVWFIALHSQEQRALCGEFLRKAGYRIFLLNGVEVPDGVPEDDEIYAVAG